MVNDLQIILGQIPPERQSIFFYYHLKTPQQINIDDLYIKPKPQSSTRTDSLPIRANPTQETLLHTNLLRLFGAYTITPIGLYQLNIHTNALEVQQRCEFRKDGTKTLFDIYVHEADTFTAQEELLHAAQTALLGVDKVTGFELFKTNEQLVHSSLVMDLAMSIAAQEEGIWDQWHKLAQEHQKSQSFQRTIFPCQLLGRTLNRRFQHKDIPLETVGRMYRNLGTYFDGMYKSDNPKDNDMMTEIFEFGCLAYGIHHRDLTYALLDLPIHGEMSDGEVGRTVVDWAKRAMEYMHHEGAESELLSHHSHTWSIPDNYFRFEMPQGFFSFWYLHLPEKINVDTLTRILQTRWQNTAEEIVRLHKLYKQKKDNGALRRYLDEKGIPWITFQAIVSISEQQYTNLNRTTRRFGSYNPYNDS